MTVSTFSPAPGAPLDTTSCSLWPSAHAALYFLGHATALCCTACTPARGVEGPVPAGQWGHVLLGLHGPAQQAPTLERMCVRPGDARVIVAAGGELLAAALRSQVADVVVLGHVDALALAPDRMADLAADLRAGGAGEVVCAVEPGRAVLHGPAGRFEVITDRTHALDQDGCLMAAGYLAGVLRGLGPADRLRLAAACAWSTPEGGQVSVRAVGEMFRRVVTAEL